MSPVPCGMVYPSTFITNSLTILIEKNHFYDQVPKEGIFDSINTLEDLLNMPQWTEERPMRVVTGFGYVWS